MILAKLSSKYQLAIPKAIRDNLNLKAGQQFSLVTIGNVIEMVPISSIKDARGSFANGSEHDSNDYDSNDYRDRVERSL